MREPVPDWSELFTEKNNEIEKLKASESHLLKYAQGVAMKLERLRAALEDIRDLPSDHKNETWRGIAADILEKEYPQ
jgi:archaellum component FlaC